jgi:predicted flap endonuclease-1-like 5' DNA nuclease
MKLNEIGNLLAMPLQAAIRAQGLAVQETISFLENFGLEDGSAKLFQFKAERTSEEPETAGDYSKTTLRKYPMEISAPILALVQAPSLSLNEMNVEFGIEIVETKEDPIQSASIPKKTLGYSMVRSTARYTPMQATNPTTMQVRMKIIRETPEGLARITQDLLSQLISASNSNESKKPAEEEVYSPPVDRIEGIGPITAERLRGANIITIRDFLDKTLTEDGIGDVVRITGLSREIVSQFRNKANLSLLEETKGYGGSNAIDKPIESIEGIGRERSDFLRKGQGILTVGQFLEATAQEKQQLTLAKVLKVSLTTVKAWISEARKIAGGQQ